MNMKVDLCGVTLNNPVMTASGTFGAGEEYSEFVDLNRLGAVVTKGVANVPWDLRDLMDLVIAYASAQCLCDHPDTAVIHYMQLLI